jgi:Tfp pilus assembly protein FimV
MAITNVFVRGAKRAADHSAHHLGTVALLGLLLGAVALAIACFMGGGGGSSSSGGGSRSRAGGARGAEHFQPSSASSYGQVDQSHVPARPPPPYDPKDPGGALFNGHYNAHFVDDLFLETGGDSAAATTAATATTTRSPWATIDAFYVTKTQRLDALERNVDQYKARVDQYEKDVQTNRQRVDKLNADLQGLQQNATAMNAKVAQYSAQVSGGATTASGGATTASGDATVSGTG